MHSTTPAMENPVGLILIAAMLISILVIHLRYSKKRKIPLKGSDVAQKLGLKFNPIEQESLIESYSFINRMRYGKKRHAQKVFSGIFHKQPVTIFELRYEISGIDKNSPPDYYSFYLLELPRSFPEITLYKEGLISKLYQLAGHGDIDFESYAFSRKFRVRGKDARFAYDFCNARMIEYLESNTDLSIEIDRNVLCISFNKQLCFEEVEHNLDRLLEIRARMPDYLFEG